MNDRGDNFYVRGGFCPDFDDLVEGVIVLTPAVGVSRRILLDRADENPGSADDLPPAHPDRENMGVAERNIGCGNLGPVQVRLLDLDRFVGQTRSADLFQVLDIDDEAPLDAVEVGNVVKCLELPPLGSLTIIKMDE